MNGKLPPGKQTATRVQVGKILTRASGFLTEVCSHSLQPYSGCALGNSLCGAACYVQHNAYLLKGRAWGSYLEVRENAAACYLREYAAEQRWGRERRGAFSIFMSSATEPFPPQERKYGVTRSLLEAMREAPPDELIVQTHSPLVTDCLQQLTELQCRLRVHLSVESDRLELPGLPKPASTLEQRLAAAAKLTGAGVKVVITVSPLLPIHDPAAFFRRLGEVAQAVVIDHFIQGDGSRAGSRTLRTGVPAAMEAVQPGSSQLAYRDEMVRVAREQLPGRVGVNISGFAGTYS